MLIFLGTLSSMFRARAALGLENLALRHQIGVLQRSAKKRCKLTPADRLMWVWLFRLWRDWRSALAIVKPETVVAWHRAGFRRFWAWKVRRGQPGRPAISLTQLVSIDFFTVPTLRFQVLYVFLVLAHDRRRIVHFNVTAHPAAEWTGQQLREAFPFDQLPRYLLRDRDAIFGQDFREKARDVGIREVLSTPRSPWQRAYVERVIGSIRRECLDHACSRKARFVASSIPTWITITDRERISPWGRTRPSGDRSSRHKWEESWPCHRWADCTTATNDGLASTHLP
jgi:transposase InsO family protein